MGSIMSTSEIDVLNKSAWEQSRIHTKEALADAERAFELSTAIDYKKGLAESRRTIGQCYWLFGNFSTTLTHLEGALQLFKELGDPLGEAEVLNLYGGVYSNMENYTKAIEHYEFALALRKTAGDSEGVVKSMNSIGDSLLKLKKYADALVIFLEALEIPSDNKMFTGIVIYNVSEVYFHLNKLEEAEHHLVRCKAIGEELDFPLMAVYSLWLQAKIDLRKEKFEVAISRFQEALEIAQKIEAEDRVFHILEDLSKAHELAGETQLAFKRFKEFHHTKEKVINEESTERLRSLEHRKELEHLRSEKAIMEAKNQELEKAYSLIEESRNEIAEKNKEITDSIKYAQRIQAAILPSDELVKKMLPNSFVFYQPKDVLSGDFYWVSEVVTDKKESFTLAAVADCTGHGVPGALMSIVGNNFLRICEHEASVNSPADALEFINVGVSNTLRQEAATSTIKDGMDISFLAIDYSVMKFYYAGAKHSMYVVRDGELTEIKGDKHPIGAFLGEELRPFTKHERAFKKGDMLYLFTDGYVDQFGGKLGKKFRYKQFRRLLTHLSTLPMEEQNSMIASAFEKWRGAFEQLDDVCVMGIRV
jgi:serine phosphatase RsbU (regulator of sigma subunit)